MDIHRSKIRDFILPKMKSVYLIDYFEGIKGLLDSRSDFPFSDFLANPRQRNQKEIVWASDAFNSKPTPLSQIDGVLKERYSYALKERIVALETLVQTLGEEEDGGDWCEILSKVLSYVDENSIYCGDGNIVIVNWGIIPRRKEVGEGSIYRSGKFIGMWDAIPVHKPSQPSQIKETSQPNVVAQTSDQPTQVVPKAEEIKEPPFSTLEETKPSSQDEEMEGVQEKPKEVPSIKTETEVVSSASSSSPQNEECPNQTETFEETIDEKPETEEIGEEDAPLEDVPTSGSSDNEEPKKMEKPKGKTPMTWPVFFRGLFAGLLFLVGKMAWLFLLLGFVVLGMYFLRGYQGALSQVNPFFNPLPSKSEVLPLNEDAVGPDENNVSIIALDRLNILLDKGGYEHMKEWGEAFKKAYPSSDYKITYYEEDEGYIQISVPPTERMNVKNQIKDKVSNFNFDVYNEPVYDTQEVGFNDPAYGKTDQSWYLNVIGAPLAWEVTMGDPNVVVAVVDDGFDISHPEFADKVVNPYNATNGTSSLTPVSGHGTHVAATAVGNCNNGQGLMGVAPKCKLMPIQVGGSVGISNLAMRRGFEYAINRGADVVNMSLGRRFGTAAASMSIAEQINYINNNRDDIILQQEWDHLFLRASLRNCVVVQSAGNDNILSGMDPLKRSQNAIVVSAMAPNFVKADFSNYGIKNMPPYFRMIYSDLTAPGVNIYNAFPNNSYTFLSGTSMASPIVTGSVALMKSLDRHISVTEARNRLQKGGKNVDEKIGPLIQLSNVIKGKEKVKKEEEKKYGGKKIDEGKKDNSESKCERIALEVRRLHAMIDSLNKICPDAATPYDTLKYKDAVKNASGLNGFWKTTTSLVSASDNSPVTLYMYFHQLSGTLTIVYQGKKFTAPLKASISDGKVSIVQLKPATYGGEQFSIYEYNCSSDRRGFLECTAKSTDYTVHFNLVRMKQ